MDLSAYTKTVKNYCLKPHQAVLCSRTIWTDGSCPVPNGPGGWSFISLGLLGNVDKHSGYLLNATNNTAELTGVLEAMKWALIYPVKTHIITDSKYCLNSITDWMWSWVNKSWTGSAGPVKNKEFFVEIMDLLKKNENIFYFSWVKGHAGNEYNEKADQLAKAQTEIAKEILNGQQ